MNRKILSWIFPFLAISFINGAKTPPAKQTATPADDSICCNIVVYPEGKTWVDSAPSASINQINYTLYDPYSLVTSVYAHAIDASANALTGAKIFQSDASAIQCPAQHSSGSPEHRELAKSARAQKLCLHKSPDFSKMKPNQWLAVCRRRTCTSCHLDNLSNTEKYPKYVSLENVKVDNNVLTFDAKVLMPKMRYNFTVDVGVSKPSIFKGVIEPNSNLLKVRVPNLPENFYTQPTFVIVEPLPGKGNLCNLAVRKQSTPLPPTRASPPKL